MEMIISLVAKFLKAEMGRVSRKNLRGFRAAFVHHWRTRSHALACTCVCAFALARAPTQNNVCTDGDGPANVEADGISRSQKFLK